MLKLLFLSDFRWKIHQLLTIYSRETCTSILLLLIGFIIFLFIFFYIKQKKYMQRFDSMIKIIRHHTHGFKNHLQIVYGFAQLDRNERIVNYLKEILYTDKNLSTIFNLNNSYISCLLCQVVLATEQKGIDIDVDMPETFNSDLVKINQLERTIDKCILKINNDKNIRCVKIILHDQTIRIYFDTLEQKMPENLLPIMPMNTLKFNSKNRI